MSHADFAFNYTKGDIKYPKENHVTLHVNVLKQISRSFTHLIKGK